MPVIANLIMCFGAMGLLVLPIAARGPVMWAVFVAPCVVQLIVNGLYYRRMKLSRALGFETVYLMSAFLLALVFRLALRASSLESYASALNCFIFFVAYNAVHIIFAAVALALKRRREGPPAKKPEDLRYGLIRDEDNKDEL